MKVSFLSCSENEGFARMVIAAFITPVDPTVQQLNEVKTVVSEAVTNAIVHGYDQGQGWIHLEAKLDDRLLLLEVSDQGCGISDIAQAMEPLYTGKPEDERSGIGFTVMQTFTDQLTVTSEPGVGTRVCMEKQL